jgi:hypothetical protein
MSISGWKAVVAVPHGASMMQMDRKAVLTPHRYAFASVSEARMTLAELLAGSAGLVAAAIVYAFQHRERGRDLISQPTTSIASKISPESNDKARRWFHQAAGTAVFILPVAQIALYFLTDFWTAVVAPLAIVLLAQVLMNIFTPLYTWNNRGARPELMLPIVIVAGLLAMSLHYPDSIKMLFLRGATIDVLGFLCGWAIIRSLRPYFDDRG